MSTKTTFKRIALVAVAALGFGVLTSVAPATAASNATAVKMTPTVLTSSPRVGETVTILVNHSGFMGASAGTNYPYQTIQTNWSSVPLTSATSYKPVIRAVSATDNTYGQLSSYRIPTGGFVKDSIGFTPANCTVGQYQTCAAGDAQTAVIESPTNAGVYNVWTTITFVPDVAGTWVVNVQDPDRATYYNQDVSITVAGGTYAAAKTYIAESETTTAADVNSTTTDTYNVDGIAALSTASTDAAATFKVVQADANGVGLTVGSKAITISSTLGSVGTAATGGTSSYAAVGSFAATGVNVGTQLLYVFPDGRSGKAVVTIAVDGVTVGTYNVTFYSTTIASLSMTPYKPVIAASDGTQIGGAATGTDNTGKYAQSSVQYILVAKDANGTDIPAGLDATKLVITSSNESVATAANAGYYAVYGGWVITGTAVGTSGTTTITVSDKSTGLIKATGVITVASKTIGSLTMTLDAADYKPGDKVTVTLTAKDASGNAIADGVYYNLLSGAVSSTQILNAYPFDRVAEQVGNANVGGACSQYALTNQSSTSLGCGNGNDAGDVSFKGGVATATFYAPASTFKLTATTNALNARLAYALQGVALTATATVTNESTIAAQAAVDAASEATDAANAATDAANAAAEAADAATAAAQDAADAVAALSTSVTAMVSALKKQITALTNLVIKIQKKVKA